MLGSNSSDLIAVKKEFDEYLCEKSEDVNETDEESVGFTVLCGKASARC
jgi:hypothetical protein